MGNMAAGIPDVIGGADLPTAPGDAQASIGRVVEQRVVLMVDPKDERTSLGRQSFGTMWAAMLVAGSPNCAETIELRKCAESHSGGERPIMDVRGPEGDFNEAQLQSIPTIAGTAHLRPEDTGNHLCGVIIERTTQKKSAASDIDASRAGGRWPDDERNLLVRATKGLGGDKESP